MLDFKGFATDNRFDLKRDPYRDGWFIEMNGSYVITIYPTYCDIEWAGWISSLFISNGLNIYSKYYNDIKMEYIYKCRDANTGDVDECIDIAWNFVKMIDNISVTKGIYV